MHMPGLARLHAAMQAVPIERMRFRIQHSQLTFECVFLTDTSPYQFGLACLAHNLVLPVDVDKRYEIVAHFGSQYSAFAAALNHGANTGQALKAGDFFRQIDAKLPHSATANDRARPRDIKTFRRDVEEADQIYLCGWAPHPPSPGNVTAKNLAKTLEWLGQGAHDWCKQHNISTRWTDVPQRELPSINPPRSRQRP